MSNIKEENLQKNLLDIRKSLNGDEIIEGYFETLNYSAEKRRKSPITGPNNFGYLFAEEWIWNTIFVVTNKKLYLINTRDNFEKVSLNEVSLDKIEYLNVSIYNNGESIIELKTKGQPNIQYKPLSNKYLDIVKKFDKVNIVENKKPKNTNYNKALAMYAIGAIVAVIALIGCYIFI